MPRTARAAPATRAPHLFTPLSMTLLLAACGDMAAPEPRGGVTTEPQREVATAELPLPAPANAPDPDAAAVCAHLAQVTDPPNPITSDAEPAYAALKLAGRGAVPCLVDAIDSTESLREPQVMPGSGAEFTQGDLAFFLLVDFGYVDFEAALPAEVREATRTRGVLAYFDWIGAPGHRERLQASVRGQLEAQGSLPAPTVAR
jgi:hypothetical protein